MHRMPITLSGAEIRPRLPDASVEPVEREGESYVRLRNADALDPFFMSMVSGSDLWTFVGSNGSLCAGRRDPVGAMFPYQTVDKLLADPYAGGTLTVLLARRDADWMLWEPWQASGRVYRLERDIFKHIHGTSLIFSETNHDLKLRFECELTSSARFGLVRRCRIVNLDAAPSQVRYLDGWHRLVPPGITPEFFAAFSYLAEAYVRGERLPGQQIAAYWLQGVITDRAEPGEHLRATCAWCAGHEHADILLSSREVERFRRGEGLGNEADTRGEFGSFLVHSSVLLRQDSPHDWTLVADTQVDHANLRELRRHLLDPNRLEDLLDASVRENRRDVRRRIAGADGIQATADGIACIHQAANVIFNCMRGGTFERGYRFPGPDFASFVNQRSPAIATAHQPRLSRLPDEMLHEDLLREAAQQDDPQFARLAAEYLPLTFGRRHGDPSRPWNRFSIRVTDGLGQPVHQYEGNWRDIFQNWEALGMSYPAYLGSMITVFLNASTADGYNPYRISRSGIDWEVFDPSDPWSHIGYWGDHQIVYLVRLMERHEQFFPGRLAERLPHEAHTYAAVPYEIHSFAELCADPRHAVSFDASFHDELIERAATRGADAKLLCAADERPVLVTMAEKLLVPFLVKLGNLVPGGGVWLNTQRPEWNDANNALAGWGLSVVTVCHMHRYATFCLGLMQMQGDGLVSVSTPVVDFLREICRTLKEWASEEPDPRERFAMMRRLGKAGERHRAAVYLRRPMETTRVPLGDLCEVFALAAPILRRIILGNLREDGLFHSYNILRLEGEEATVDHLPLMLEGQVAALDSRVLCPEETVRVVRSLRASDLYRADLQTYLLYPDRVLPGFLERNILPPDALAAAPVLRELLASGDCSIVTEDTVDGTVHFQGDLHCADDLEARLDGLQAASPHRHAVARDRHAILDTWERMFRHREFTGRSGSMFAFEGLGSVYWHMVAKLLVAVQECHRLAVGEDENPSICSQLADAYEEIRGGLGFCHTPADFGAFPTDPYSHSPRHRGAQQPGMTGQVKEEILTRWGELGVEIKDGCVCFSPVLLGARELSQSGHVFHYVDTSGNEVAWELPAKSLGFTFCQTPVCYQLGPGPSLEIAFREKGAIRVAGCRVDRATSQSIFNRTGFVKQINVRLPERFFRS